MCKNKTRNNVDQVNNKMVVKTESNKQCEIEKILTFFRYALKLYHEVDTQDRNIKLRNLSKENIN